MFFVPAMSEKTIEPDTFFCNIDQTLLLQCLHRELHLIRADTENV